MIPYEYVKYGKSFNVDLNIGKGHKEHIVPCKFIRDLAFEMYKKGEDVQKVAKMIESLLKISRITRDEAKIIDKKYKDKMPEEWVYDEENPHITARLDKYEIKLKLGVALYSILLNKDRRILQTFSPLARAALLIILHIRKHDGRVALFVIA